MEETAQRELMELLFPATTSVSPQDNLGCFELNVCLILTLPRWMCQGTPQLIYGRLTAPKWVTVLVLQSLAPPYAPDTYQGSRIKMCPPVFLSTLHPENSEGFSSHPFPFLLVPLLAVTILPVGPKHSATEIISYVPAKGAQAPSQPQWPGRAHIPSGRFAELTMASVHMSSSSIHTCTRPSPTWLRETRTPQSLPLQSRSHIQALRFSSP